MAEVMVASSIFYAMYAKDFKYTQDTPPLGLLIVQNGISFVFTVIQNEQSVS